MSDSDFYEAGHRAGYEVGYAAGVAATEAGSEVAPAGDDLAEADAVALDAVILKVTELTARVEAVEAEVGLKYTG